MPIQKWSKERKSNNNKYRYRDKAKKKMDKNKRRDSLGGTNTYFGGSKVYKYIGLIIDLSSNT